MNKDTYIAIMAGGIGSRFWPASRTTRPKQFLDILGVGKSLIRLTYERFLKMCPAENIFVVTNANYKALVKQHLPELTDNQILCEPTRNNTGPCVAYTAFKLQALNPNANFVIAPSDHIILKEDVYVACLQKALDFTAKQEALLTLGIQPTRPDTGYGYIHFERKGNDGIHKVFKFTEKPDAKTALSFVESGEYLWNAGIFVWSASSILKAFQKHAHDIFQILSPGQRHFNTHKEQEFIDAQYPLTPNVSVDYAILEKSDNVFTIPCDIGWSDLGTWASLFTECPKDENGNVMQGGKVLMANVTDSLVRIPVDKLAVIKGLQDYIVVDEEDVLLIYPKGKEQEIKTVNAEISKKFGEKYS